jgi:hypothetical protein
MKELTRFDEIKKLEPFTKILFVDKEKCTLEIIAFLYADGLNDAVGTRFYACNSNKYGCPKEYYFRWLENNVYLDWTYDDYKKIEKSLKEKSILKQKLEKIKNDHWGYVKGKLVCFYVNTAAWKLEDINMHDVKYTIDDIESICINKPKFEDVKKIFPKPNKDILKKCKVHKLDGKYLNNSRDTEMCWYYNTVQYQPDKIYAVYTRYTDDAEGYCYANCVYIDDL